MSTLHLNLMLELDKMYVDEKGHKVSLVREFTPEDPDYIQGFRFRGDNKVNYLANGTVVGHLGAGIQVKQPGAYNLVGEYVEMADDTVILKDLTLTLEEGHFYRNGLGQPVLIIGTTVEGSHWWKRGYRFTDQRGTFYKPNGSVDSWPWGVLDIVMEITGDSPLSEQITDEEMIKITKAVEYQFAKLDKKVLLIDVRKVVDGFYRFCKKTSFGCGVACTVVGVTVARYNPKQAAILLGLAGGLFATDHFFSDDLAEL